MATPDQRAHMLAIMRFFVAFKAQVGYNQARPMLTRSLYEQEVIDMFAGQGRILLDCSEMVTLICRWAGLKDPNGMGYDGFGDTQAMYDHLPHYSNPGRAHTGALIVLGAPSQPLSNQHVVIVMWPGPDPVVFSHGSSAGPISLPLSAYEVAEPSQQPVTFLDIGKL